MTRALAAAACRAAGLADSHVLDVRPIGGGCINQCAIVRTRTGQYFLKANPRQGHAFFRAEADGLAALAEAGAVRTPRVLGRSGVLGTTGVLGRSSAEGKSSAAGKSGNDESLGSATPWLLLEWIEEGGGPHRADWSRLGRELAALHRHPVADQGWGWHADNVIGSLPQPNGRLGDWPAFWSRRRILSLARELGAGGTLSARQLAAVEEAARRVGDLIGPAAEADGPSLLHGDLWSGNVIFDREGAPVLVDPAVYVGHREVDLAMTRLFGGFPPAFYRAYDKAWPPVPGRNARLCAYQLYPLLVHARLFGGGYVGSAVRAAESAVRAAEAIAE